MTGRQTVFTKLRFSNCDICLQSVTRFKSVPVRRIESSQNCQEKNKPRPSKPQTGKGFVGLQDLNSVTFTEVKSLLPNYPTK